ncbi:Gustatory receptor 99 [Halyomorpha halys]|nr:Gustatory receptor 99 [Halyomorpha halys]
MELFTKNLDEIFRFSRTLGMFPFDEKFKLSKKLVAYCAWLNLVAVFGTVCMFYYDMNQLVSWGDSRKAFFVIYYSNHGTFLVTRIFSFLWWITKREDLFELIEDISNLVLECNYRNRRYPLTYCNYLICFLQFVVFFYKQLNERWILTLCVHLIQLLSASSMVCKVGEFWDLILLLNNLLKEVSPKEEFTLKKLERLSSLAGQTDEIYGPLIFLCVANCFGSTVVNLYALLGNMFNDNMIMSFVVLGWVGISIICLLSIVCSSGTFNTQIQNFNEELRTKMMKDETQEYSENEILNFHLIAYKETNFTACGFFNIDYTLISSMISVSTTYLVIALQYGGIGNS